MVNAMDEQLKEKLSAFMDGELGQAETADIYHQLQQDEALKACWSRFHLIRDALKREAAAVASDELATRVSAALQDEPTVLAPKLHRLHFKHVLRHAASFAVAASLTAVAILGIQSYTSPVNNNEFQVATQSPQGQQWKRVSGTHWNMDKPEVEDRLNAYLVKHNEFASGNTAGGMLPYVTIVGYDRGQVDTRQ
jgi:sigma-E factor negative regulatory protein RseA